MWICTYGICYGIGVTKNEAFANLIEKYTQEFPNYGIGKKDCKFYKVTT